MGSSPLAPRQRREAIRRAAGGRRGLTLLEVVLVLSVLVIVAAIAFPNLTRPFAHQRLVHAAEQVRAEWTHARVSAMSSGLVHVFRCQAQGSTFRVEAWVDAGAELETSAPSSAAAVGLAPVDGLVPVDHALPDGVRFGASQTGLDSRADTVAANTGMQAAADELPAVFFYPDGTASDASLVLVNEYGSAIQLQLRGLTGIVTVGESFETEAAP